MNNPHIMTLFYDLDEDVTVANKTLVICGSSGAFS